MYLNSKVFVVLELLSVDTLLFTVLKDVQKCSFNVKRRLCIGFISYFPVIGSVFYCNMIVLFICFKSTPARYMNCISEKT